MKLKHGWAWLLFFGSLWGISEVEKADEEKITVKPCKTRESKSFGI